jgi:hypothetical protein
MEKNKVPYICGPLIELILDIQEQTKAFYVKIADLCKKVIGKRAFVPHESYDPIKYPNFTPRQVDRAEREQVCEKTSLLIVIAIAPSWGGGIEVEIANGSEVPIVIFAKEGQKISRLLLGNPAVWEIIYYKTEEDALKKIKKYLLHLKDLEYF